MNSQAKMTPYPEYKATNLPWLPQIPAHWEISRAKNLYYKAARPVSDNAEVVTCFRDGQVTLRKNRRTSGFTESLKEIGYQGIAKGDLVIHVMDAFAGAVGVSDSDGKGTPVYSVCVAKDKGINNYYYAFIVREMAKRGFIQALYRGIRERSSDFRFEVFAAQSLPVPPAAEQEQIVRYLDSMTVKINKLIRAKKKQIALLQEQKQAIINQAVTKGLNPNAELKDSGIDWLGQIPAHWEVKKAKYCVNINHGSDPVTEGNVPVYGSGTGSFKTCGEFKEGPAVLVGRKGATLHIPHYITGKYWNVDTAFDVKAKKNFFLHFYYFLATCFDYHFYISQTTLPSMTQTDYLNMKLPVPPQQEQYDIIQHLVMQDKKIDNLIAEIKNVINSLLEYKNSLIASVVTGQVDIRNIQVEEFDPADLISATDDDPAEDDDQPQEESEE